MPAPPSLARRAAEPGLLALAVFPAVLDQVTTDNSVRAWTVLSAYLAICVISLAVRRRWPIPAFAAIIVGLAVAQITASAAEASLSTLSLLPLALACYAAGAYASLRASAAAMGGGAAVVAVGLWINHLTASAEWRGGSDVIAVVAPLPIAWAVGIAIRSNRELLAVTQQRADDAVQRQQLVARQATQQERLRIARDMHDVVAHSLTLLVVHAETLRARSSELPAWAGGHADAVAGAGRQAVRELGGLLAILRAGQPPGGGQASTSPTPSLADLAALVEAAREAGHRVELRLPRDLADSAIPAHAQLALYRIAQESLANVRRHAPGADIVLTVDTDNAQVAMSVVNGPATGPPRDNGTGLGVTGMRERTTALGGHLVADDTGDGGFEVRVTIPLPS